MPTHLAHPVAQRLASLSVVGLLSAAVLAGCGSSSSNAGSGAPQGTFTSGPGGGFSQDPALAKKIQQCLKAAGIKTGFPQGRPSGAPTGSPPSGFPSGAPSGGFSAGPGGGFGDPKIQTALKACGITLPIRASGSPSS